MTEAKSQPAETRWMIDGPLMVKWSLASPPQKWGSTMNVLMLDLDGTLITSPIGSYQSYNWQLRFPQTTASNLQALYDDGVHLCIVTNQSNIGRFKDPSKVIEGVQSRIDSVMKIVGRPMDAIVCTDKKNTEWFKPSRKVFDYWLRTRLILDLKNGQRYTKYRGWFCGDAEGPQSSIKEYQWGSADSDMARVSGLTYCRPERVLSYELQQAPRVKVES